jgi:ankyrin repeat protein
MNASFKIFKAARLGKAKEVKQEYDKGGSANDYCNGKGSTALMSACQYGNTECVRVLLEIEADVNAVTGGSQRTALMTAGFYNHYACAKLLVDHGAKLRDLSKRGWSALFYASASGAADIVQLLCDSGAKVDRKDKKGNRAIMIATANGHAAVVEVLIKAGAAPAPENKVGFTPWIGAARIESSDILANLIRGGGEWSNYDLETSDGLEFAMKLYHTDHFDKMEGYIMDKTVPGYTHFEVDKRKKKKKEKVRKMSQEELDRIKEKRLLEQKRKRINKCKEKYKGKAGKVSPPFIEAAIAGNPNDLMLMMEDEDMDVNQREREGGFTALMYAAFHNHVTCLNVLLDNRETQMNLRNNVDIGQTAIQWANDRGSWECVQILMDRGAKFKHPTHIQAYLTFLQEQEEERQRIAREKKEIEDQRIKMEKAKLAAQMPKKKSRKKKEFEEIDVFAMLKRRR